VAGEPAATLSSPPQKLGAEYTFRVRATWTADGVAYEVARTSTVRAGGTGKLTGVRGDRVK
jgi:hypothetical protein